MHEIHHILRLAPETFAQFRVLGGNAHRAGVQVADPHHHTAHGHQGRCGKAKFLCPQHTGDHHVTARHQLAVRLQYHLVPQPVHNQGLMGLRHPQFPGKASVVDGISRRRPGAAVKGGHQYHLGPGLGHACRHGSHPGLAHQLHGNPRPGVGIFQIIDQLCQILNGINVVMRGRGNEPHTGGGMAGLGYPGVDLAPGKLAALPGLCPLCHLNLNLLGADQVAGGHPEPSGGHLLDGGTAVVILRPRRQPL